jgi:phosphatidylserine/phosphatidylglycerophosphate/cardiolipin synthase-like enzyme
MPYSTLKEKYDGFVLKIKKHPFFACLIFIFLICFLIFVYTHPLNTEYRKIARTSLPQVSAPDGTFTLTTEPDQGIMPVLSLIKNSKTSIDLVMYEFKDKKIADALIDAEKRGVVVRVLINQGYRGQEEKINEPAYAYLQSNGVSVRWTPNYFSLTHQKTMVVDKNEAFIMTFNFTPEYYETSRDFGILDKDINDVNAIEDTFNSDYFSEKKLSSNGDDLVWSPGSDQDMLLLINSAKKELDIYNEEMNDDRIVNALSFAAKRGIDVNIIMTYQSSWKAAFEELKDAGVHLHLFHGQKELYIHAKIIIADSVYAFLGSENFSYTSLNENRELGIFLSDETIINSLLQTFNDDWQEAKDF